MAGLVEDGDGSHCAGEDLSLASMCREEAPAEAQAGAADAVFLEDAVVVDGFDADYFSHCDGTAADLAVAAACAAVVETAARRGCVARALGRRAKTTGRALIRWADSYTAFAVDGLQGERARFLAVPAVAPGGYYRRCRRRADVAAFAAALLVAVARDDCGGDGPDPRRRGEAHRPARPAPPPAPARRRAGAGLGRCRDAFAAGPRCGARGRRWRSREAETALAERAGAAAAAQMEGAIPAGTRATWVRHAVVILFTYFAPSQIRLSKQRRIGHGVKLIRIPRNVVDSIQAINSQNADKIIGLRVLNSLKTHKQS